MTTPPQYTGTLRRGSAPDTIEGELVDQFGWVIHIRGTRDTERGGYVLSATVGDRGTLRFPFLDEETG